MANFLKYRRSKSGPEIPKTAKGVRTQSPRLRLMTKMEVKSSKPSVESLGAFVFVNDAPQSDGIIDSTTMLKN
jgi:hypothetical protein